MPDANGEFNLPQNEIPYGTILHVEGSDHSTMASGSNSTTLSSVAGCSRQTLPSTFQSIIPAKRCNLSTRYSLKVVKATISGRAGNKPVFTSLEQIYVDLTDKTASAVTIKSAVQDEWGDDYTVVTSDGLEVKDSAGTTGKIDTTQIMHVHHLCTFTQVYSFGNVVAENFLPY